MSNIENKLDNILMMMEQINTRLDRLEVQQNNNNLNCSKMSDHIDFIDDAYNKLRHPISYITGQSLEKRESSSLRCIK